MYFFGGKVEATQKSCCLFIDGVMQFDGFAKLSKELIPSMALAKRRVRVITVQFIFSVFNMVFS